MANSIKILGLTRLLKKTERLAEIDMTPAMGKALAVVRGHAKANVAKDTGDLAGSIRSRVTQEGKNLIGRTWTNLEYAPYVEFGTGAKGTGTYPYPTKEISLSYRQTPWGHFDEKTQQYIWSNGQVAQPFMYPALNVNKTKIKKIISTEYIKQIAKLTR